MQNFQIAQTVQFFACCSNFKTLFPVVVMDLCFQLPESPVAIYLTSYAETTNKKLG
jgi:hypothetical protein